MSEKVLQSKIRTKRGIVGYVNNLFKETDNIYSTYDIRKLNLLSSHKDIIDDKLVKILNLWEEINDNIENEEEFQKELSQSLQLEEQVEFENKEILVVKKFGGDSINWKAFIDSSEAAVY